ncbi:MAG: hypothetical protein A3F84_21620 [Candidatus Handelsmanbacteria bacterium RIFCSPLOWO2_12_FULL_64_10]|uniref:Fis family transcriptional regulator n=1 Tax=Handelsmanbacteria sp. (strain RIFCSPLOWO2_12_FULL_64_10) TaxID=1817868 RepID=A0A1F6CBE5_HANXR|nr:MAG: hypothetical protein A3F84_21620 [Candidatus Handelsmanbacteria bacterium RIFCSPLOWO2_12_FULL_64_10]
MAHILIVDDESRIRRFLAIVLKEDGHVTSEASSVQEALGVLSSERLDLVITDQKMPGGDGLSLLAASKEIDPALPVVVLTAHASIDLAVEAMRQGAFDFITKPFKPEEVRAVVRRACERTEFVRENERLKKEIRRLEPGGDLVGDSPAVRTMKEQVAQVAPTLATVLITGETGTGKELVARAIHQGSPRADRPFVAVNCAALTETLLESELFGHEKGAFTGAAQARVGLFEAAHGGTLFLDEAGEMSLPLQAKLLRVLTDRQVIRVGATTPRSVDVRILVATHRDLQQRIQEGKFREDLYYRLAVVPLDIPPLRERREDIPALVEHFLRQVSLELKMPRRTVSPPAMEKLLQYSFPGNARELRNLIERAYILTRGAVIGPQGFPVTPEGDTPRAPEASAGAWTWSEEKSPPGPPRLKETLESMERTLILSAIRAAGGVQAEAARGLGISRSDLAYKVKKYRLEHVTGRAVHDPDVTPFLVEQKRS